MDKETLSNYGWIVICVLILAVMIALATPFGSFIANAVKNTTQGLFDTNQKALNSTGLITMEDQDFYLKSYAMLNAPESVTKPDQAVFISEADIDKFVEVKVDGNEVDEANYTVTEGSTVVTFTQEYTKTLENGIHTIEIISNDGMAKCEFNVDISQVTGSATFSKYFSNPGCHQFRWTHTDACYILEETTLTWEELQLEENGAKYGYNASVISNTKIGESAFNGHEFITSITIPSSVTTIDNNAFFNCDALTCVTFQEGLITIGNSAFNSCNAITSIQIPSSVTTIGQIAFQLCTSLKDITFAQGLKTISNRAFDNCIALKKVILPKGLTAIGEGVFANCVSLTDVTLPEGLTTTGVKAFEQCAALENVTFSNSITTIDNYAFTNCAALKNIIIPNDVKYINDSAFWRCTSLTSITYEGTVAQWNTITKHSQWNDNVPATFVQCSDAQASLN